MSKKAMTLALEALEYPLNISHEGFNVDMAELLAHRAIKALEEALAKQEQEAPKGYKLVMVPKESPTDEPDWDECIRQAEVSTGLKVERNTLSIVIREVRRWLIAKQEQGEPVAWVNPDDLYDLEAGEDGDVPYVVRGNEQPKNMPKSIPLYTTPQPAQKPLMVNEICNMVARISDVRNPYIQFARAIEAAHSIKGDA